MFGLPNELTISQVENLQAELLKQLQQGSDLCLDMSDVTRADTACIQLLCALQKALQLGDHSITWEGSSEALINACQSLGVANYLALNGN